MVGKKGDKIGMVWYTMYAWCIRICICMVNEDVIIAWPLLTESMYKPTFSQTGLVFV